MKFTLNKGQAITMEVIQINWHIWDTDILMSIGQPGKKDGQLRS